MFKQNRWFKVSNKLPPLNLVVECLAKSGYRQSVYRIFASRKDCQGELIWLENESRNMDGLINIEPIDVLYWKYATPLPKGVI